MSETGQNRTIDRIGEIVYRDDAPLGAEAAIDLYRRSTLGERRPVDRPDVFAAMLAHADVTITAWQGDRLVGIARTLTDYAYVAYLADLAVDAAVQKAGIGRRLIAETERHLQPGCNLVLLAAPAANDYYPRLGFEANPRAWMRRVGHPPTTPTTPADPGAQDAPATSPAPGR